MKSVKAAANIAAKDRLAKSGNPKKRTPSSGGVATPTSALHPGPQTPLTQIPSGAGGALNQAGTGDDAEIPVVIWPEWNDAEISSEKWATKHAFEDPEGPVLLPKSLRHLLEGYKRPVELATEGTVPVAIQPLSFMDEAFFTLAPTSASSSSGAAFLSGNQVGSLTKSGDRAGDDTIPASGDGVDSSTSGIEGMAANGSADGGAVLLDHSGVDGNGMSAQPASFSMSVTSSHPILSNADENSSQTSSFNLGAPSFSGIDDSSGQSQAQAAGLPNVPEDDPGLEQENLAGTSKFFQANRHLLASDLMRTILAQLHFLYEHSRIFRNAGLPDEFCPWDNLYPKAKDGSPAYNPMGKYAVKLFWLGSWRRITVDDRIPVDEQGRPLVISSPAPHELWPLLISKALMKLAATSYKESDGSIEQGDFDSLYALKGWIPEKIQIPSSLTLPGLSNPTSPLSMVSQLSVAHAKFWTDLSALNVRALQARAGATSSSSLSGNQLNTAAYGMGLGATASGANNVANSLNAANAGQAPSNAGTNPPVLPSSNKRGYKFTVDCPTSYHISFYSREDFFLDDEGKYLQERLGLHVKDIDESFPAQSSGSCSNVNKNGYVILADCRTSIARGSGKWKLRLVSDAVPIVNPERPLDLYTKLNVQDFDEMYIPNKHNILFRLQVFDNDVELISGRGKGIVSLHAYLSPSAPDDPATGSSGGPGAANPTVGSGGKREDKAEKKEREREEKEKSMKESKDANGNPVVKHRFILQGSIEPSEFVKLQGFNNIIGTADGAAGLNRPGTSRSANGTGTNNGQKATNSAKKKKQSVVPGLTGGTPTAPNPTSGNPSTPLGSSVPAGGSAGQFGGLVASPGGDGPSGSSGQAGSAQSAPVSEPHTWRLRLISPEVSSLMVSRDTEKEDRYRAIKDSWEASHPGRSAKAREARESYLKQVEQGIIKPILFMAAPPSVIAKAAPAALPMIGELGGASMAIGNLQTSAYIRNTDLVYKAWTIVKDAGANGRQFSSFRDRNVYVLGMDGQRMIPEPILAAQDPSSSILPNASGLRSLTNIRASVEGRPSISTTPPPSIPVQPGTAESTDKGNRPGSSGNSLEGRPLPHALNVSELSNFRRPSTTGLDGARATVCASTLGSEERLPFDTNTISTIAEVPKVPGSSQGKDAPPVPTAIPTVRPRVLTPAERQERDRQREQSWQAFERFFDQTKMLRQNDREWRQKARVIFAEKLEELGREVEREKDEDQQRRDQYRQRVIREIEDAARRALEAMKAAEMAALEVSNMEEQAANADKDKEKKKKGGKRGASGFTGRLVVEYLLTNGPAGLKFAIAGRSRSKLEDILKKLAEKEATATEIPILIADASDVASLEAVVSQTRVVLTTVGPFMKHGVPLVEACVRLGTDYVDSTGESPFIRKIIDLYHEKAAENGVSIVPSAGFDSLPSDIGVLLLANHFAKKGLQTSEIRYSATDFAGGVSGGTIHSAMGLMELPFKDQIALRKLNYLAPQIEDSAVAKHSTSALMRYDRNLRKWQTYFVMEIANTRYVQRSYALFSQSYGPYFKYSETVSVANVVVAALAAIGLTVGLTFMMLPPFRWLIKKLVPQGTGPSEKAMKKGHFTVKLVGEAEDGSKAVCTIHGDKDPGYSGTALMLSETALALALQRDDINRGPVEVVGRFRPLKSGVLTVATGVGLVVADRLRKAGFTLNVEDL
ncbi:hypothetical protein HDU96_003399 [Phlyctochytrium bullatum]|nr:hypothetical protein HDU96_003399 [Phlyctochytrium bullatum]